MRRHAVKAQCYQLTANIVQCTEHCTMCTPINAKHKLGDALFEHRFQCHLMVSLCYINRYYLLDLIFESTK